MNSIHFQISLWWLVEDLPQMLHLVSLVFWWVTLNFKQQGSTMKKGSGLGDDDSAGQTMVNYHVLSSRIGRRCVATTGRVGKRCCRRLWLRKLQFSYGKPCCFPHVVSPHPHRPSWWGSLERYKVIGEGKRADRIMEMENVGMSSKRKRWIGGRSRALESQEDQVVVLLTYYLGWDTCG